MNSLYMLTAISQKQHQDSQAAHRKKIYITSHQMGINRKLTLSSICVRLTAITDCNSCSIPASDTWHLVHWSSSSSGTSSELLLEVMAGAVRSFTSARSQTPPYACARLAPGPGLGIWIAYRDIAWVITSFPCT